MTDRDSEPGPGWVRVRLSEVTPDQVNCAERGLTEVNKLADHLVSIVRDHKQEHEICPPYCPGQHFVSDLEEWSWPHVYDEDGNEQQNLSSEEWATLMVESITDLQGIITVMATRLAGYDTD